MQIECSRVSPTAIACRVTGAQLPRVLATTVSNLAGRLIAGKGAGNCSLQVLVAFTTASFDCIDVALVSAGETPTKGACAAFKHVAWWPCHAHKLRS